MGINKDCILKNGFTVKHWVISSGTFDAINGIVVAKFIGYKDEQSKIDGLEPAITLNINWNAGDNPELAATALAYFYTKLSQKIDGGIDV